MIRFYRISVCALAMWMAASAVVVADNPHFPEDRPFDITHIRLEIDVDLEAQTAASVATIAGKALRPVDSIALDAVDFKDVEVRIRSASADITTPDFDYDQKKLIVPFGRTLQRNEQVEIGIKYRLHDPDRGLHFFKPSEEDPQAPYQLWSQGQSTSNRYWIPSFDHPNEMQTTEIICTVEKPYIAVSNGELVETQTLDDGRRSFHWKLDKPHVVYLVTLVVGDFVSKSEMWNGIPVTYYVRKEFEDQMDNSFRNTTKMLDFFSAKIGVDYPWPKYDQLCCYQFGGGMENTSSTTLGESTLHDDRAHLDTSSDGLVAHELAHQWFGDLITCNDWAHLWLNEGFATYFEALWDEHHNGDADFAYNMMRKANRAKSGGKDKPIVDRKYPSPGSQFDARAYPKGAWVVHMLRRRLGDEMFWAGINAYVKQFGHRTVETSDLRRVMEHVSGHSLSRFFHDWTARPGHPIVNVAYEWLPEDKLVKLVIEQKQKDEAFHFPLHIDFVLSAPGDDYQSRTFKKYIDEKETVVYFSLAAAPQAVRIDPAMAVLMELSEDKPRRMWLAQLHDINPVLQIRAIKHLENEIDTRLIEELRVLLLGDVHWSVRAEAARVLGEADEPDSRAALLAAVDVEHPKVLAAVMEAFGDVTADDQVNRVLMRFVDQGHQSYKVQRAVIDSYAKLAKRGDEDALRRLRVCLQRDSHREMIRTAALRGLAKLGRPSTIDELQEWLKPKHKLDVRRGAIEAIGDLAAEFKDDEAVLKTASEALRPFLTGKHRRLKRSSIFAASSTDGLTRLLKSELKDLANGDDTRAQWAAKRALDGLDDDTDHREELERLEKELERLREQNEELHDRIRRLEAREAEVAESTISDA